MEGIAPWKHRQMKIGNWHVLRTRARLENRDHRPPHDRRRTVHPEWIKKNSPRGLAATEPAAKGQESQPADSQEADGTGLGDNGNADVVQIHGSTV